MKLPTFPSIPHQRLTLAGLLVGAAIILSVASVATSIHNRDQLIEQRQQIIEQRDRLIKERDQQINNQNGDLKWQQDQIDDLNRKLEAKRDAQSRLAFIGIARARSGSCDLAYIRQHESTNNYQATNGQYTGAYQQSTHSWQTYGDGSAPTAGQASPASQDAAAAKQYAAEGTRPWSVCG